MTEASGASLPPPALPNRPNPWLIALLVIVGMCCLCVGALGLMLAFGPDFLHELGFSSLLPILTTVL